MSSGDTGITENEEGRPLLAEPLTINITPGSLPEGVDQIHPKHHDIYCWQAIYHDGTSLLEVEGEKMHFFSDIDLERLAAFVLLPLIEGLPQYSVLLGDGKRLIFVRRRPISYNPNDSSVSWTVWHLLGYQTTINGTNVKSISYIAMNGNSFLSDDDNVPLGADSPPEEQVE